MTWARWTLTVISLVPSSRGDLLVEQARDHQRHHLTLARRQRLVSPAQLSSSVRRRRSTRSRSIACWIASRSCWSRNGLGEKLHRPRLHRLHRHRDVAMARDEDDGDRDARARRARAADRDRSTRAGARRARGTPARPGAGLCRNSCAVPKVSTRSPTEASRLRVASRTARSSSTTKTTAPDPELRDLPSARSTPAALAGRLLHHAQQGVSIDRLRQERHRARRQRRCEGPRPEVPRHAPHRRVVVEEEATGWSPIMTPACSRRAGRTGTWSRGRDSGWPTIVLRAPGRATG